jgi:type VI secretion system protein ImpH
MATEVGRTDPPLAQLLLDEPYRFDFFQAVRLLEQINPGRRPVGHDGDPSSEAAHFRSRASLIFPPSQVYRIEGNDAAQNGEAAAPKMTVAFMGLTGPLGLLPQHYTELVAERSRYGDTALAEFLEFFDHRALSLFYRAWEKHRVAAAYERGEFDHFTEYLFDFVGMGTRGLRRRLAFPDKGLLLYAGLIAQRPHSASAVAAIVGDYFKVPARVEQFSGQWIELTEIDCTRLGAANNRLGVNSIAGERVWDDQSKFRLTIGPIKFKEFTAFLPVGSAFQPLMDLARLLAGMEFDFDLQLILEAVEVPACRLETAAATRPMLGWSTWLKTREFSEDDSQVVLRANN